MATRANQQSSGQRFPAGISACHSCIRRLLARVHKLKTQLAALQAENERLRRCGKRQAAPFSKEKRVQNPQKPGRKLPVILETMTGIRVTQSALTQDALRQADGKLGQFYQQTGAAIGRAPAVFTDDTSWKTAGEVAFLMVFVTDQFVYFQIRPRHRNQEVREVLPADYPGTLITDRGRSYDAQELAEVRQQKCLAHLLRSLSEGLKTQRGRSRSLGLSLQRVLRQALALWGRYRQGEAPNFAAEKARLNAELDELLARRRTGNHLNQRWLDDFGPRNRRGELLRFLDFPDLLEPTNNRAERALRPAVIQRKVSHCSKNARGAAAQAIFATLFATLQLREAPSMLEAALAAFATGILPPEV